MRISTGEFPVSVVWVAVALSNCIKDAHAGGGPVFENYIGDPPGDEGQIAPRISFAPGNYCKDVPLDLPV